MVTGSGKKRAAADKSAAAAAGANVAIAASNMPASAIHRIGAAFSPENISNGHHEQRGFRNFDQLMDADIAHLTEINAANTPCKSEKISETTYHQRSNHQYPEKI